jgi:hypothetical protein
MAGGQMHLSSGCFLEDRLVITVSQVGAITSTFLILKAANLYEIGGGIEK